MTPRFPHPSDSLPALVGRRIRLRNGWDAYPVVYVPAHQSEGVVASYDGESLWLRLDLPFPELAEWDNQLQLFDYQDPAHPLVDELEVLA